MTFVSETIQRDHLVGNLNHEKRKNGDSVSVPRDGEKWYNLRVMLNKRMLHPKDSAQYGGVINDVVTDLTKRIYYLRQGSPTGDLVTNMASELYRFSLEGMKNIFR